MDKDVRERRRALRVRMAGNVYWESRSSAGECCLVNISSRGAALEFPLQQPLQIGTKLRLVTKLAEEIEWHLDPQAYVVRKTLCAPDRYQIGVEFSPSYWQ